MSKLTTETRKSVSPYLIVHGAAALIDFLARTFAATETHRTARADGTVRHAEVRIGDSIVMLADATPEFAARPATLHVYVDDVDAVYQRALQAGAHSLREPANQASGNRNAGVADACGNQWWIATPEDAAGH